MVTLVDGVELDKEFLFPDGQPHIKLKGLESAETHTIQCSIRSSDELVNVLMINEILRRDRQCKYVNLKLGYLIGARMDRPIDDLQPFTLSVVADALNTCRFNSIEIFNVHSIVAEKLLRAKNVLPLSAVRNIGIKQRRMLAIAPDKGAQEWVANVVPGYSVSAEKDRESQTGKIHRFEVMSPEVVAGRECIIIDDICDGGATFKGLAKELRRCGAIRVELFVSHGIFSKGYYLEGIDKLYTTNTWQDMYPKHITVFDAFSGEKIQGE